MDRGRVGTLAIGNKTIRDQMIAHQQEVHMARISKIKNRKPGSSPATLDNTAPVIIQAALVNPRKIAKKKEFNSMTEKENRVLLKRISHTLTAPPKITDAEYQRMKKLIGKNGKKAYEDAVFARHHRQYLDHLKEMGPYYDPNEWELDYKRQKVQQMFMREVPYERPKGFKTKELPPMKTLGTIHDKNEFRPHHTQLKGYVRNPKLDCGPSKAGHANRIKEQRAARRAEREGLRSSEEQRQHAEADAREANELACTHRYVRVTKVADGAEAEMDRWGEVTCFLENGEMLLICAEIGEDVAAPAEEDAVETIAEAYVAEAEIDIAAIAELRGENGADLLARFAVGEAHDLQQLAQFVSEGVELKVENGLARIILSMREDNDELSLGDGSSREQHSQVGDAFFMTEGALDGSEASEASEKNDPYGVDLAEDSLASVDADAYKCSFDDAVARIHVIGGGKKYTRPPKPDTVMIRADVSCEACAITVDVEVTTNSKTLFKGEPAVPAGTTFTIKAVLPTIMQADGELMHEYFHNLVYSLALDTHFMTGKNTIHVVAS